MIESECSMLFTGRVFDLFTELSFGGPRFSLEPKIDEMPQLDPVVPPVLPIKSNQLRKDVTCKHIVD